MTDFEIYQSPYSWRYGSDELRQLWSESDKRRLWRKIWLALAEVQAEFGLVSTEQVEDIRAHVEDVDMSRALEIETEIKHDLMSELKAFAEQCPLGGGVIHLGMTSMDVKDNAEAMQIRASLDMALQRLHALLELFVGLIDRWADTPVIAFTHLQPAEPTTLGYRLAQYGQDLLMDWENLSRLRSSLRGKGIKGAVGTSASFAELIGIENLERFESRLSEILDLPFYPLTTQTYPRKQDYDILSGLAGLGASLYKFAFDLRILQTPAIGELAEPFGEKQVGSSAMPFKRNPEQAEKMDSLARLLAQFPRVAWDNAAHSLLERTIDDSANRRTTLPEAFLIADELLLAATRIVDGLRVDEAAMARNLSVYAPFAATERVMMALVKGGADRQAMHERLRQHTMQAWDAIRQGEPNPLVDLLAADPDLKSILSADEISRLMDAQTYVGAAPQRARSLVKTIRNTLAAHQKEERPKSDIEHT